MRPLWMDHWSHCDATLKEVMTKKPGMVQAWARAIAYCVKSPEMALYNMVFHDLELIWQKKKKKF